jgi:predicted flap endonuclease-1-like 5' DNA nuclease
MPTKIIAALFAAALLTACGAAPTRPALPGPSRAVAKRVVAPAVRAQHVYTLAEMGASPEEVQALGAQGVSNMVHVLEAGKTADGRQKLAAEAGVDPARVLALVGQADLMRVQAVGPAQARLLQAAGVRTVVELAGRNPENLSEALAALNAEQHLSERTPALETVGKWVEEAKTLERVVLY